MRRLCLAALLLAGCSTQPLHPPDQPLRPGPAAWDPSQGFVVHEWGTLTSVVGSDGALVPGLHHEEEDLPSFVADRIAGNNIPPVNEKMETPVTYFYAPAARKVTARVEFPRGILTQWFPYVRATAPSVIRGSSGVVDPWLHENLVSAECRSTFGGAFREGMLDWGDVEVLPPHDPASLPSPLGHTTWGFARNTLANPIRVTHQATGETQTERFLFYRGLGNFDLPVVPSYPRGDTAAFTNTDAGAAMGGLFLMTVDAERAGFVALGDLAPGATSMAALPRADLPHGEFVPRLKEALAARLAADGLYQDEAQAMVDTWERSYFLTPGTRLLYLLPQSRTEGLIPLRISPAPDRLTRTMVIRLELLTPEYESRIGSLLARLGSASPAERDGARAAFLALGRFAEPHLARALARNGDANARSAGDALLEEVRGQRRWAPTAAE